jgi:hypothetical protein
MTQEDFQRLNDIAEQDNRQYIVIKNPITGHVQVFLIEAWKPSNKNINPYNDLLGKDVTNYMFNIYMSFFKNNGFDVALWKQQTSSLKTETLQFPDHIDWMIIKKNL